MYFIIGHYAKSGVIEKVDSKEELIELLDKLVKGHTDDVVFKFLDDPENIPKYTEDWGDFTYLIISGDIAKPVPKEIVKTFSIK